MGKSRISWCVLTGVVLSVGVIGTHIFNLAEADVTTDASTTAGFSSTLPAYFNSGTGTASAFRMASFASCSGIIQGASAALQTALGAAGGQPQYAGVATIDTVCPEGKAVDPEKLTCTSISTNGKYDPAKLKLMQKKNQEAMVSLMCKKAKFEAIKGELECYTNQAKMLAQILSGLQESVSKDVQTTQQQVTQIKTAISDREAQIEDVTMKLQVGKNGEMGLVKMQEEMEKQIAKLPSVIQAFKDEKRKLDMAKLTFEGQIQTRKMALTRSCFINNKSASYRCGRKDANGLDAPVTAKDYAVCRFEQNQFLNQSGGIERDKRTELQARDKAAGLSGLLEEIAANMPDTPKLPSNPQEYDKQASQQAERPSSIHSYADIEAQYGSRLAQYNGKGLDIRGFVMTGLKNCSNQANATVENELAPKQGKAQVSQLYAAKEGLQKDEDTLKSRMESEIFQYSQLYGKATEAMTGTNMPLIDGSCKGANPAVMIECLEGKKGTNSIMTSYRKILTGLPNKMEIKAPSGTSGASISLTCNGISGCVSALRSVSRNLETEKKRLTTFKTTFVAGANQRFDSSLAKARTDMQKLINGSVAGGGGLMGRLQQINKSLAGMGVSSGFKFNPVPKEELQKDEDGLYRAPTSTLNLIGGGMTPPMPDVTGDDMTGSMATIATETKKLEEEIGKMKDAETKMMGIGEKCKMKDLKGALKTLEGNLDSFTGCEQEYCDKGDRSIDAIIGQLDTENVGNLSGSVESLKTGATGMCEDYKKKQEIKKKCDDCKSGCTQPDPSQKNSCIQNCDLLNENCKQNKGTGEQSKAKCSSLYTKIKEGQRTFNEKASSSAGSTADK